MLYFPDSKLVELKVDINKSGFEEDLISIECQHCSKNFLSVELLTQHISKIHPEEIMQVPSTTMDEQEQFYQSLSKLPYSYVQMPQHPFYTNVPVQQEPPPLAPIRHDNVVAIAQQNIAQDFVGK